MNTSFWEQRSFLNEIDVLIVGSGIVGLTAAIRLASKEPKLRIAVAERDFLPSGASTRNAGFACFGSISELLDDLKGRDEEVSALIEQRWSGLGRLRKLLGDEAIGFRKCGGYEVFLEEEGDWYARCEEHIPLFNKIVRMITGKKNTYRLRPDLIPGYGLNNVAHLLENRLEGSVDTGRMMRALIDRARSEGIEIFNGCAVQALHESEKGVEVVTTNGRTFCTRRVLVATNGFARKLLDKIEVEPARNLVLVTSPIKDLTLDGTFHHDRGYIYFRNIGKRILIGGARHLDPVGEQTDNMNHFNPKIRDFLTDFLSHVVVPGQSVSIESEWTGIMGLGPVKSPVIQEVRPGVFAAVRLGGMGVAIGSEVGKEAADLVRSSL